MTLRPVYATNGDWVALLNGTYLYDTLGEWIGWLEESEVYGLDGFYLGRLSPDFRVVRERIRPERPRRRPPDTPSKVLPPAHVPLAPLFAELPWRTLDVFMEEPEVFAHISDLRPDWED